MYLIVQVHYLVIVYILTRFRLSCGFPSGDHNISVSSGLDLDTTWIYHTSGVELAIYPHVRAYM